MDEKKIVTWEMFKKYHGLILEDLVAEVEESEEE